METMTQEETTMMQETMIVDAHSRRIVIVSRGTSCKVTSGYKDEVFYVTRILARQGGE